MSTPVLVAGLLESFFTARLMCNRCAKSRYGLSAQE
jgi:hypothetical protein